MIEITVYGSQLVAKEKMIMQWYKSLRKAYQTASSGDESIAGTACRKIECQPEYDRQNWMRIAQTIRRFSDWTSRVFETSLHYIVIGTSEEATDKKRQREEAIKQIDQMMELLQNKRKKLLQMKEKLD